MPSANDGCARHIPPLTFFFPYHEVSGVPVLFSRLATYLAVHCGCDVEVVDYADGYMARTLASDRHVRVRHFTPGTTLRVESDRLLVMQSILPATIHSELQPDPATRLLFWTLHPMNFVQTLMPVSAIRELQARRPWLTRLAGRTVLRRFTRELVSFVRGLHDAHSLVFVDGSTLRATCDSLGISIPHPQFVPTPCGISPANPTVDAPVHTPLSAAWVGRLDDFKVPMLAYTLGALATVAETLRVPIHFTVVGDGPLANQIDDGAYTGCMFSISRAGTLAPTALDRFLSSEVDLLLAMGTSALEGAKLGVPTVLLDIAYGPVRAGYVFRWLFDSTDFGLGSLMGYRPAVPGNDSLTRIVADVLRDRRALSSRTHSYCLANHSMESVATRFLAAAVEATFSYGDMAPTLRRKSVVRRGYECARQWSRA
jgi:hypothetical protein